MLFFLIFFAIIQRFKNFRIFDTKSISELNGKRVLPNVICQNETSLRTGDGESRVVPDAFLAYTKETKF